MALRFPFIKEAFNLFRKNIFARVFMENRLMDRSSSVASINELVGNEEDKSLARTGEEICLTKCEDEVFIANAYRYCSRYLIGNWAKCPPEEFDVHYVSGGLTNYLYMCSLPNHVSLLENEPRKVLIRIYGSIVDRKQRFNEGVVFTLLSERGFGPKSYGVFYSGRIEEYIPYRHLYTRELADPEISKMIANKTGHFHCMKLPLNKQPVFLWESFEKFLSMCNDIKFESDENQKLYEALMKDFDFHKEYDWLRTMLIQLNSPVVFCHNDLQEGNILYIKEDKKTDITLIDYDYSSYNYRGFDFGNHFCEFMYEYKDEHEDGFKTYPDGYPTKEEQIIFASEYLDTLTQIKNKILPGESNTDKTCATIHICSVEELLHEANRFALASHLFWALWSIIQAHVSKIDFNYLKYARVRMETYKEQKKQIDYE